MSKIIVLFHQNLPFFVRTYISIVWKSVTGDILDLELNISISILGRIFLVIVK